MKDISIKFDKLGGLQVNLPVPVSDAEFEAKGNSKLDCAQTDYVRRFRNAVNQAHDRGHEFKDSKSVLDFHESWQMGGSQLDEDTRSNRDELAKLNNKILTTKDPDYRKKLLAEKAKLEKALFALLD